MMGQHCLEEVPTGEGQDPIRKHYTDVTLTRDGNFSSRHTLLTAL